ncbi:hypothetical protein D915_008264 [Fasciola hepatica]|uniref:Uncharacterized protein n=1 Tax=Fasciola hepatica TaxID=6192 RepID=A0A4E0RUF2_FASHE|nr:hypothetical protein D915_008264 [Fasciola hepatica]
MSHPGHSGLYSSSSQTHSQSSAKHSSEMSHQRTVDGRSSYGTGSDSSSYGNQQQTQHTGGGSSSAERVQYGSHNTWGGGYSPQNEIVASGGYKQIRREQGTDSGSSTGTIQSGEFLFVLM